MTSGLHTVIWCLERHVTLLSTCHCHANQARQSEEEIGVYSLNDWLEVDLLQLSFSQMQNDLLLVGIWEIEV